ncbi:hypothetical protein [Micromonospora sp. HK10]|uniref:hypothetical protein n=1 Tax=Micromonospora sp. HK10 TaxID=1538294 RepID=UPI000AA9EAF6|nr:hypothetical protein [Micromonospora sp. HK10]
MTPTVSRLLRWAAVIGLGIALTLAVWQDPVLAYGPGRAGVGPRPGLVALAASAGVLAGFGLVLAGRYRPAQVRRRPVPSGPVSAARPPGRRRSRR